VLGRLGRGGEARDQYRAFLHYWHWDNVDRTLPEVAEAKSALAKPGTVRPY
jgi:hypothetical protein